MFKELIMNTIFKCKYLGTCEQIPIYLNDDFVKANGYMFSVVFKGSDNYIIAVDNEFLTLSKRTRNYILQHEIGHIVNNHLNLGTKISYDVRMSDLLNNKVLNTELEADIYACKVIGLDNFINSIDELIKYPDLYDFTIKEYRLRKEEVLKKLKYQGRWIYIIIMIENIIYSLHNLHSY